MDIPFESGVYFVQAVLLSIAKRRRCLFRSCGACYCSFHVLSCRSTHDTRCTHDYTTCRRLACGGLVILPVHVRLLFGLGELRYLHIVRIVVVGHRHDYLPGCPEMMPSGSGRGNMRKGLLRPLVNSGGHFNVIITKP